MHLRRRFVDHVRASGLLGPGDRVIVACSGGADSVALLHLLHASSAAIGLGGIAVAHLDHGLREGSREDAAFVAEMAAALGVPATLRRTPVRRRKGESPEDAARRVRYGFLRDVARADPGAVVVTAHQMDDQAETVLYRALRGAGIEGLRGVLPELTLPRSRVRVVRPLLPFRREDLRHWLRAQRVAWREDPSNRDGNDRARLRNVVLPAIRRVLRRDPVPPLARLAVIARAATAPPRPGAKPAAAEAPRETERTHVVWEERPVGTDLFLARLRAKPGSMELLDADRVRGPLSVRGPRPGDRFHALGMTSPQRLGHYLQRRGVERGARASVALLCDADGIVCVAGHGIAARAALETTTRRTWVVRRVDERE